MKIAINALSAQTGAGVSQMRNLLPELARADQKNSCVVFYSVRQRAFAPMIPGQFEKVEITRVPRNSYARVLWEQFIFPFYLARYRIDVLYSVGNTTCILAPCKVALLVENANPYSRLKLPWSRKDQARLWLLRVLGWLSAQRAIKIRFVSQNSRDLIVPRLGVDPKKCVVIPHGVLTSGDPISAATEIGSRYILTIGANGPHRNTERLLLAFSILVTQYGYGGDLVVVGNTGSANHTATLHKIVSELGLSRRVRFEGEVPHNKVSAYFKDAELFVFPSLEETFGVPLLEAMAAGVLIAAADCDLDLPHRGKCFNPFREICADAAVYFNPFDPQDMAQAIQRVLTDAARQAQLVAKGKERVKQYNFEDTVSALVQLFTDVYNG